MKPLLAAQCLLIFFTFCCRSSAGQSPDKNTPNPVLPNEFELHYSVISKKADVTDISEISEYLKNDDRSIVADIPNVGRIHVIRKNKVNFFLADYQCKVYSGDLIVSEGYGFLDGVTLLKQINKGHFIRKSGSDYGVDVSFFKATGISLTKYNFTGDIEVAWSDYGRLWPACYPNCADYSTPVFMRANGTLQGKPIDRHFAFWKLNNYVRDETTFEIPDGYYCPRGSETFDSTLNESYSLSVEVVVQNEQTNYKVWTSISDQTNLERVDSRGLLDENGRTLNQRQILDRKQQIQYSFDEDVGTCNISRYTEYDPSLSTNILDFLLGLKKTDNFVHNGQRKCRIGMCDSWTGYFNKLLFTINFQIENYARKAYVPVSINIYDMNKTERLVDVLNIFNYQSREEIQHDFSTFDTQDCFDDSNLLEFQLMIEGEIPDDSNILKFDIMTAIISATTPKLNPMRLSDILIFRIDAHTIVTTVVLLEDIENSGLVSISNRSSSLRNFQVYSILENLVDQHSFFITPTGKDPLEAKSITKNVLRPEHVPLPIVPKTFQAHVRAIMKHNDDTSFRVLEIDEFFDDFIATEAMIIQDSAGRRQVIKERDSFTSIIIQDMKSCIVVTNNSSKEFPTMTARQALGLVKTEHFVGNDVYAGIPALKFKAKDVPIPTYGGTAIIEILWSQYGLNWPYCGKENDCRRWAAPLLITVHASINDDDFHHRYEFTEFYDEIKQSSGLQVPDGMYCENWSSSDHEKPTLNNYYSMKLEFHTLIGGIIDSSVKMLKIGSSTHLYRFDNRPVLQGIAATLDYHRIIIDVKNGYGFEIDIDSGKCSLNSDQPLNLFFDNQKKIQYLGQKKCREGVCDVWAGLQLDWNVANGYFTKKTFNTVEGPIESYVPVMFTEYTKNGSWAIATSSIHVFDFRPEYPDWSNFDVTDCYDDKNILRFQMKLQGSYSVVANNLHRFQANVRYAIQSHTSPPIADLRLSRIKVSNMGDQNIIVFVTMLEDVENAGHKSRTSKTAATNQQVYDILAFAVFQKTFSILFTETIDPLSKTYEFMVVDINKEVISEEKTNEESAVLKLYGRTEGVDVKIPGIEFTGSSIEDCAEACMDEKSFDCESFTYCKGTCKMIATHYQFIPPEQVVPSSNCIVFARNFSLDYDIYEADRVISESSDKTIEGDMEKCSYLCSDPKSKVTGKTCMGYDICFGKGENKTKKCTFHSRHILEIPHSQIVNDVQCIHMSKKDILDFDLLPNSSYTGSDYDRIMVETSPDACAHACILKGNDCHGFESCSSESDIFARRLCFLLIPKDKNNLKDMTPMTKSPICDHYYRLSSAMKSGKAENNRKDAYIAVVVVMFIVGLAAGGLVAYCLDKRNLIRNCFTKNTTTSESGDQYNMNLINEDSENLPSTSKEKEVE